MIEDFLTAESAIDRRDNRRILFAFLLVIFFISLRRQVQRYDSMNQQELSKAYNPKEVEDKWYSFWESNRLFHATVNKDKTPYTVVIPHRTLPASLRMGQCAE